VSYTGQKSPGVSEEGSYGKKEQKTRDQRAAAEARQQARKNRKGNCKRTHELLFETADCNQERKLHRKNPVIEGKQWGGNSPVFAVAESSQKEEKTLTMKKL